jgi:hypothetical protein
VIRIAVADAPRYRGAFALWRPVMRVSSLAFLALAAGALLAFAGTAHAKPAKCFTTDDGEYACDFRGLDKAGSFTIAAAGKPTYTLEVDSPGVAFGFADFGTGRNVALPGTFRRAQDDGACWDNDTTEVRICAW